MGPSKWEKSRTTQYPFMSYRLYLYLRESFIARSTFDQKQNAISEAMIRSGMKRGAPLDLCARVPHVDYTALRSAWEGHAKDIRGVTFRIGHLGSHQSGYDRSGQWHNIWYIRYFDHPRLHEDGVFRIKRRRNAVYLTDKSAVEAAMAARRGEDHSIIDVETKEDVLNYLLLVSAT